MLFFYYVNLLVVMRFNRGILFQPMADFRQTQQTTAKTKLQEIQKESVQERDSAL